MKTLPQALFWLGLIFCPVCMASVVFWATDGNYKTGARKH